MFKRMLKTKYNNVESEGIEEQSEIILNEDENDEFAVHLELQKKNSRVMTLPFSCILKKKGQG